MHVLAATSMIVHVPMDKRDQGGLMLSSASAMCVITPIVRTMHGDTSMEAMGNVMTEVLPITPTL